MILDDIAREKRNEVEARKRETPAFSLEGLAATRDFASALKNTAGSLPKVIAEVKKASPSKGVIRPDFDPVAIAKGYKKSGASAVSVLTDEKFFQGKLSFLTDCRRSIELPLLRKDFIIDKIQIEEARAAGADAILLIAALLDTGALRSFGNAARELDMAALVEVHDESELESALESGANIIGINNRNLQTFEVSINTTFRLAPMIPQNLTIVSESGIGTKDDLKRLRDAGIDAVLIGESLMRAEDPGAALKALLEL